MNTKRFFGIALALGLIVMATAAFAGWGGHGGGHNGYHNGNGMQQNLTPEQQQKLMTLEQNFATETQSLREDLWAKQTELNVLSANSQTDPKLIKTLVSDIKNLRSNLNQQRKIFADTVQKEVGITIGSSSMHNGHGGNHNGGFCGFARY